MTNTIINTIFCLVKVIEKEAIDGLQKKEKLYAMLKDLLGEDKFNESKETIDFILETIIFISKTHKIAGINIDSFSFCCK